ncbi:MAG: M20 family metallopeptidase [Enterocloster sp.]
MGNIDFAAEAKKLQEEMRKIRRDVHQHPELAMEEYRTSGIIKEFLKKNGIEILSLDMPTSVAGIIRGGQPGKTAALRADMDALPIKEQTCCGYSSENEGVMHACGHDVHLTCLLGAAKILMEHRQEMKGNVLLLFQAAEENLQGAKQMLEAGVLKQGADVLFAMHTNTGIEAGKVAFIPGPSQASGDVFQIRIEGKGGHGAFPHTAVDPVMIGAQLIVQLQSIVSRNIDPIATGVVSICRMTAGTSNNIIPETALLNGTYRAMDPSVRSLIRERIRSICAGMEVAYGCRCIPDLPDGCPPIVNDPELTEIAREACCGILGEENVLLLKPAMVGDDMGFFLEHIPGVLGALGVRSEEQGITAGNHTPQFNVDEECLWVGAACMAGMAWDYLVQGELT